MESLLERLRDSLVESLVFVESLELVEFLVEPWPPLETPVSHTSIPQPPQSAEITLCKFSSVLSELQKGFTGTATLKACVQQIMIKKCTLAVFYCTSCWYCVGMKFEIVGIDPNCQNPKPRPTTPQDLFKTFLFLYQKENFRNT